MLATTEEQELALYRWARAHGSRPEGSDRRLLEEAKGLTSEQIDNWWDRFVADSGKLPLELCVTITNILTVPWAGPEASVEVGQSGWIHTPQTGSVALGMEEVVDMLHDLPEFPGHSANLSLSSSYSNLPSLSDRSSTATSSSEVSGAPESWEDVPASSSLATLSPLNPGASDHWNHVDIASRSSEAPSTALSSYSGDTLVRYNEDASSSMVVFEDFLASQSGFPPHARNYIDPTDWIHVLRAGNQVQWTQNRSEVPRPLFSNTCAPNSNGSPANNTSNISHLNFHLPRPTQPTGNFSCTTCHHPFPNKKGDWKRHESSQCDPQTVWVCMLGDPAVSASSSGLGTNILFLCAFCPTELPREEMSHHLIKDHNIGTCIRKKVDSPSRTFYGRKDKLKHHLRTVHKLSSSPPMCPHSHPHNEVAIWEKWHTSVTPVKKAWGCGFCGCCLFTWEGRLEHVATHFSKDKLSISSWSSDLVIKGLLRQPRCEFNILEQWHEVLARACVDEQTIGWDQKGADQLKRRLELRHGQPLELAQEALRKAVTVKSGSWALPSASDTAAKMLQGSKAWPNTLVRSLSTAKTATQVQSDMRKQVHRASGAVYQHDCLTQLPSQSTELPSEDAAMGKFI